MNYYNEHDPHAAQWLRNLIAAGQIPPGHVDPRDIQEVRPDDLDGYTHIHLFTGIGGWAHALRLAGWPDNDRVVTGSCPCQPFSCAGKGAGTKDTRHLWPEMRRLVDGLSKRNAPVVFGEQVASRAGRDWLAGVRVDLEAMGYAVGAADLCAASQGAPHIRQRLFWVAEPTGRGYHNGIHREQDGPQLSAKSDGPIQRVRLSIAGDSGWRLADANSSRFQNDADRSPDRPRRMAERESAEGCAGEAWHRGGERPGRLGEPNRPGREELRGPVAMEPQLVAAECAGGVGFWSASQFVSCRDGKARRIEPDTFPLAHGVSGRVGLLRGYGNAIVPQVAARFIRAYSEGRLAA